MASPTAKTSLRAKNVPHSLRGAMPRYTPSVGWRKLHRAIPRSALPVLGRCLSGPVIRQLGTDGRSPYFSAAVQESGLMSAVGGELTVVEALQLIYGLLQRGYRCDYVYRAALTRKLILSGRPHHDMALLPELRVWRSKADLAVFNGTSIAYEIKTELDNLDRLETQLRDYSGLFDRIFVVTHAEKVSALRRTLPKHVGILVLDASLRISTAREPLSNAENVNVCTILDALRREEIVDITRTLTGSVPQVPTVEIVRECSKRLATFSGSEVHSAMVAAVKKRPRFERTDLVGVPPELAVAFVESGLRPSTWAPLVFALTRSKLVDAISRDGDLLSVPQGETVRSDCSREGERHARQERQDPASV